MTKNIHTILLGLALILSLSFVGQARETQDSEVNSPEMLIKATRFLEQKPFDRQAKDVRSRALTWVIATDQVSVTVCSLFISGIDKKYKYSGEIFGQYTIGMAAYKLANADKVKDEDAAQLAGIESSMSSYEAMVKEQPKARNAFMDDLLAKRVDGSLAKYVAENNCKK